MTQLKPFEDHGVVFSGSSGQSQQADCVFCGKQKAFHVNSDTGLWVCSSSPSKCGRRGNVAGFLTEWALYCHENTDRVDWRKLIRARGGLPKTVFSRWKVGYNYENNTWLIPVFGEGEFVCDVRRWTPNRRIIGTSGCKVGLFNFQGLLKSTKYPIDICEGEWDAMALHWLNRKSGRKAVVIGVPGARIFKDEWVDYFQGKDVIWWFDHDEDGRVYSQKGAEKLSGIAKSQRFCCWPEEYPDKFDVRDFITGGIVKRGRTAADVSKYLTEFLKTRILSTNEKALQYHERPKTNPTFSMVIRKFRKRLYMWKDMQNALKLIYAIVLSNQFPGDPLWMYLIAPPSSGKTELLMTLDTFFEAKIVSTVNSKTLVSGYASKKVKDPSLIPQLLGKTAVFKDWTEILDMNSSQREEVYSRLRGAYDGYTFQPYANGIVREYKGTFSLLAGVTQALYGYSNEALLGDRFLRFHMRNPSPKIANKAAMKSLQRQQVNDGSLSLASASFLDRDVNWEIAEQHCIPMHEWMYTLAQKVVLLREVVNWQRAGMDEVVSFGSSPDSAIRLTVQFRKLAAALTVVEGVTSLTPEVRYLIERVASSSMAGYKTTIVEKLILLGEKNVRLDELKLECHIHAATFRRNLQEMDVMKMVTMGGNTHSRTVSLGNRISTLWREMDDLVETASQKAFKKVTRRRKRSVS